MTDWLDGGDPGNRCREGIDRGYETNPPPRFDGSLLSCGRWSQRLSALGEPTANENHGSLGDETPRHGTEQWELYAPEDR
jgi:hypothetical protein